MGKPLARVRSAERPGNAGSNTAADQIAVIEQALQQIPAEQIADVEIVVRADSAGATHDLMDFCREGRLRYSVGYELSEQVRAAILRSHRSSGSRRWRPTAARVPTGRSSRSPTRWTSRRGPRGRA